MNSPEPDAIPDFFPGELPRFTPGQCVEHRLYRYRGLIVDFDMHCTAGEEWYWSNASQPDPDQPWYHVLVDGSDALTYVAQENLAPENPQKITHPLVAAYFEMDLDGHYQRNDEIWPSL
ncbi:MAG: heat shock protein HspQ [Planctomycetota bacterium]